METPPALMTNGEGGLEVLRQKEKKSNNFQFTTRRQTGRGRSNCCGREDLKDRLFLGPGARGSQVTGVTKKPKMLEKERREDRLAATTTETALKGRKQGGNKKSGYFRPQGQGESWVKKKARLLRGAKEGGEGGYAKQTIHFDSSNELIPSEAETVTS